MAIKINTCDVIGFAVSEFTAQDGNPVRGYNVFFQYDLKNGRGKGAGKLYLGEKAFAREGIEVGSCIQVAYNSSYKKYELVIS